MEPFIGQISTFAFDFAPRQWAFCNGTRMAISQNQVLFSLLGTTFGGDGVTTFNLPNLQSRVPLHPGNGIVQGQAAGEEAHTLILAEMPMHNHSFSASISNANLQNSPNGNVPASPAVAPYAAPANLALMNAAALGNTGGGQPHPNLQPFLVLNFCIALQGVFPSRN